MESLSGTFIQAITDGAAPVLLSLVNLLGVFLTEALRLAFLPFVDFSLANLIVAIGCVAIVILPIFQIGRIVGGVIFGKRFP